MSSYAGLIPLIILFIVIALVEEKSSKSKSSPKNSVVSGSSVRYESGKIVSATGEVIRILSDDTEGSRHQRFILQVPGRTLLVAHNIDLAPRIPNLRVGDVVTFSGVYEPNDKGGVIHWTHHDPRGKRAGGWLRHNGQVYQ